LWLLARPSAFFRWEGRHAGTDVWLADAMRGCDTRNQSWQTGNLHWSGRAGHRSTRITCGYYRTRASQVGGRPFNAQDLKQNFFAVRETCRIWRPARTTIATSRTSSLRCKRFSWGFQETWPVPIAVSILGLIFQLQRSTGQYSCSIPRSCVATKPTLLVAIWR